LTLAQHRRRSGPESLHRIKKQELMIRVGLKLLELHDAGLLCCRFLNAQLEHFAPPILGSFGFHVQQYFGWLA